MKIVDVPQTGKLGLTVTYPGRNGLIRRTKVTPANPRSSAQTVVRSSLASQARAYDSLSDAQQAAWIAAAAKLKSRPTLGQSGPLTGLQYFTKVNCALLAIGSAAVTAPPATPIFPVMPVDGIQVDNTSGTVTVKLHATAQPGAGTMLWACAPQNSGTRRAGNMVLLGTLGNRTADGTIDITSAYAGRFGAPAPNQRVFVAVQQQVNGVEDQRVLFSARVPAAA